MHKYRQSSNRLIGFLVIELILGLLFARVPIHVISTPFFILLALYQIGSYLTETITVNKDEVLLKTGLLSQKTMEVPLQKINSVAIHRGILARILNYGTIAIFTGNDVSGIKFRGIDDPEGLKRRLKP